MTTAVQRNGYSIAWRLILLYGLMGWIVFVAWRIEVLNAAAGHPLPGVYKALAENRAIGGSGKWRVRRMTPDQWRRLEIPDVKGIPDTRPLTPDEEARMAREIAAADAVCALRDFMNRYASMLQQFLVVIVLTMGLREMIEHRRRPVLVMAYALPALIALLGGVLAIQRGYFTGMCIGV